MTTATGLILCGWPLPGEPTRGCMNPPTQVVPHDEDGVTVWHLVCDEHAAEVAR